MNTIFKKFRKYYFYNSRSWWWYYGFWNWNVIFKPWI